MRAVSCQIPAMDKCALIAPILILARADCQDGEALLLAAEYGHAEVVLMLLDCKENAPQADCQAGEALARAAEGGHLGDKGFRW
jgi:hypothetical protein